ncbi:DUF7264 domain-containing protein [Nocardia farcinica]|uniref:LtfC-like domain-containing protein n=1 Tax=Nocardia farcinica TaxID=37329 RepID=UPI0024562EC5|nr:hypothetical protein [Nocardia farcinica]
MTIGHQPLVDALVLVVGQDFIHEILMPAGETVPAGTTCELVIYDRGGDVIAEWPATVTSNNISWDVDAAVADTINIPATYRIFVHYSDGADFCWYRGHVVRD